MKQILQNGTLTYRKTCPTCGCVFLYEQSDIEKENIVTCPYCHNELEHQSQQSADCLKLKYNPCDSCWVRTMLSRGITYVGDLPCQTCSAWNKTQETDITC